MPMRGSEVKLITLHRMHYIFVGRTLRKLHLTFASEKASFPENVFGSKCPPFDDNGGFLVQKTGKCLLPFNFWNQF
jgi:hypothetical protein